MLWNLSHHARGEYTSGPDGIEVFIVFILESVDRETAGPRMESINKLSGPDGIEGFTPNIK
jgi:hypothetical protein